MNRKMLILGFMLLIGATPILAQLREVPPKAEAALKEKYGEADSVNWVDNLINFTAVFQYQGSEYKMRFTNSGNWQMTEKTISAKDVPATVLDGFAKSKFGDKEAEKWWLVETPKIKEPQYRALVVRSTVEKKYLYFEPGGRLVKETIAM